jgi:hypothetical protein
VRGRILMRTLFWLYLAIIAAGLTAALVIGELGR